MFFLSVAVRLALPFLLILSISATLSFTFILAVMRGEYLSSSCLHASLLKPRRRRCISRRRDML